MINIQKENGLTHGLSNIEGCKIFESALNSPQAHIIATKRILDEAISTQQNNEPTKNSAETISLENKLKSIWAEVLEASKITPESDFFALGGDSLTAIQLIYKIKTELSIQISPDSLLEHSNFQSFLALANKT